MSTKKKEVEPIKELTVEEISKDLEGTLLTVVKCCLELPDFDLRTIPTILTSTAMGFFSAMRLNGHDIDSTRTIIRDVSKKATATLVKLIKQAEGSEEVEVN